MSKSILFDGAMGTYYQSITGLNTVSEWANTKNPELIKSIHEAYLNAGAQFIRTNTFAAYTLTLGASKEVVKKLVIAGYQLANEAVLAAHGRVVCSLGPIRSSDEDDTIVHRSYLITIDAFIEAGGDTFIFETFDDLYWINVLSAYIKSIKPMATIFGSVSINSYGYTKSGISYINILEGFCKMETLTAFGFNCAIGAGHMRQLLARLNGTYQGLIALPNAGYPEVILDRQSYQDNSDYFADQLCEINQLGAMYIGGCCGTTPKHIKTVSRRLGEIEATVPGDTSGEEANVSAVESEVESETKLKDTAVVNPCESTKITKKKIAKESKKHFVNPVPNHFRDKLIKNEFVIAVELDPPYGFDISKLMESANILKTTKVDIITLADSPLGRTRVDAIMMASKIKREVGIDVMPHLCCRDKNTIAIRAMIMAAHIENIRNILLVTGDPIPQAERGSISGVFNVNAIQLMGLVSQLNMEHIEEDPLYIGGAFDPKKSNIDREIERIMKKKEAGAAYLLTQPIFSDADIDVLIRVRKETGIKILAGILPLISYKNARFIHNEFSGMDIPDDVMDAFEPSMSREVAEAVGTKIAISMSNKLKEHVDGLYFMTPFNRASMIKNIIEQI
ncbi:MAG: bifunctional homocysteine S-methyltransferase/methylenetetrahydrofolate reductase [Vallitaleaceae bacterium]|nr:bifunctional homocysteine S-methyltransferase/methylenetetrahydrofolate reductase [Vallitaleaceae bacterium]